MKPRLRAASSDHAALSRQLSRGGGVIVVGLIAAGLALGFRLGANAAVQSPKGAVLVSTTGRSALFARPVGLDLDEDGKLDIARPVDHGVRREDAYGSGAFGASRDAGVRAHRGADFVAEPGELVRAPIAGRVTRIGPAYRGQSALSYVEIRNPLTHYTARVLYVGPTIATGVSVAAGDAIGNAQDIRLRYPSGMTNHVHVEITGRRGEPIDPLIVLPDTPRFQARAERHS